MSEAEPIRIHQWFYSPDHAQLCQIIESQTLWDETVCRVWLPGRDSVVRIPASRLKPLESACTGSPDDIAYVAAAARVADTLTQDVLLAPIEASVIPLPQVRDYRLNLLAQEQRTVQEQLDQKVHVYPELVPLLITRVEGDNHE